VISPPKRISLV